MKLLITLLLTLVAVSQGYSTEEWIVFEGYIMQIDEIYSNISKELNGTNVTQQEFTLPSSGIEVLNFTYDIPSQYFSGSPTYVSDYKICIGNASCDCSQFGSKVECSCQPKEDAQAMLAQFLQEIIQLQFQEQNQQQNLVQPQNISTFAYNLNQQPAKNPNEQLNQPQQPAPLSYPAPVQGAQGQGSGQLPSIEEMFQAMYPQTNQSSNQEFGNNTLQESEVKPKNVSAQNLTKEQYDYFVENGYSCKNITIYTFPIQILYQCDIPESELIQINATQEMKGNCSCDVSQLDIISLRDSMTYMQSEIDYLREYIYNMSLEMRNNTDYIESKKAEEESSQEFLSASQYQSNDTYVSLKEVLYYFSENGIQVSPRWKFQEEADTGHLLIIDLVSEKEGVPARYSFRNGTYVNL